MKFTVQSKDLLRVLNALLKVIQKKNSIPILDTVLLGRAEDGRYTLTGSSAENMLVMAIDITPEAGTAFRKVCLNAQQLQAVIATLPEQPVEISVEDNYATTIRYQGGQFNLMSQDAECYPLPASPAATRCAFSLPTAIFLPAFKSALPCSAHDEMRPQCVNRCARRFQRGRNIRGLYYEDALQVCLYAWHPIPHRGSSGYDSHSKHHRLCHRIPIPQC